MTSGASPSFFKLPPITVLAAAVVLGVAVAVVVVLLTHRQPWIGLELESAADGKGAVVVEANGPGRDIPPGTVLTRVTNGTDAIDLLALDLTIEPDGVIHEYWNYREFIERQDRLARIQESTEIRMTAADGREFRVKPDAKGRPWTAIPVDFWVGLAVGLIAWLVSAAVFAFRPGDASARYLLLSGAATLIFAPAAAIYTTRELAVDGTVFRWASDLNFFGGSLFAASFVALLLHYPRKIGPTWVGVAVVVLYVGWFVAQQVGVFESMTFARRFLVMIGVAATFVLAGVHWFRTRKDPVARAALQWFLLSWMLGTSLFALFILLPQTFGVDTTPVQGYSFLLFLLVYGGLSFGILRYRLFELGDWWRRVAVWTLAVLLLVVLDLVFLFVVRLSLGASHLLTLVICGVVWFPLRALIWGRVTRRREEMHGEMFGRVMDVALAPVSNGEQNRCWRDLLANVFDPLEVATDAEPVGEVTIGRDGLAMRLPAIGAVSALQLDFAHGGRRLFSPKDAALAGELISMLGHAIESRTAHENGVAEERGRIARDMHDNIGAQLLAALHSRDAASKDSKIRETLADLRDVINNASAEKLALDETLAELRLETADRLAAAGVGLRWTSGASEKSGLDPIATHALRSIIREAVSNVIRHADARNVGISVDRPPGFVVMELVDDGRGFDPAIVHGGNGLTNMRARLDRLGGTLEIAKHPPGMRLVARIPITESPR